MGKIIVEHTAVLGNDVKWLAKCGERLAVRGVCMADYEDRESRDMSEDPHQEYEKIPTYLLLHPVAWKTSKISRWKGVWTRGYIYRTYRAGLVDGGVNDKTGFIRDTATRFAPTNNIAMFVDLDKIRNGHH